MKPEAKGEGFCSTAFPTEDLSRGGIMRAKFTLRKGDRGKNGKGINCNGALWKAMW